MSNKKTSPKKRRGAPATTPEAREKQLVALAVDLAEEQLRDGTASSQVMTHYLKLGTIRESVERQKLEEEVKLLKAKTEAYDNAVKTDELYREALNAMRAYSGHSIIVDDEDE